MSSQPPIRVGVCGFFQSGKSMLVNCLLGREVALSGEGEATTRWTTAYQFAAREEVELQNGQEKHIRTHAAVSDYVQWLREVRDTKLDELSGEERNLLQKVRRVVISLPHSGLKRVLLVDTPGFGHNEFDDDQARAAVRELDVVLFVQPNEKSIGKCEKEFLHVICELEKPCLALHNCKDTDPLKWCPKGVRNHPLEQTMSAELKTKGIFHYRVGESCSFNFIWHWFGQFPHRQSDAETIAAASALSRHFPEIESNPGSASQQMIERSRVEEIRRFVFPEPERSMGVNAYCLGTLHRAAAAWADKAQKQVQQINETITTKPL